MPGSVGIALLLAALSAEPAPAGDTVYFEPPPRAMRPLVLQNAPAQAPQQTVVIPDASQPQQAMPAAHSAPAPVGPEPGRLEPPPPSQKPPLALAPPSGGIKRPETPKGASNARAVGTALGSLSVVV